MYYYQIICCNHTLYSSNTLRPENNLSGRNKWLLIMTPYRRTWALHVVKEVFMVLIVQRVSESYRIPQTAQNDTKLIRFIQLSSLQSTALWSIIINFHCRLGLQRWHFPQGFQTKIQCSFVFFPLPLTRPVQLNLPHVTIFTISRDLCKKRSCIHFAANKWRFSIPPACLRVCWDKLMLQLECRS
jgi:hypothetical protein